MPLRATPERIVIVVLVLAAALAACEKQSNSLPAETSAHPAKPPQRNWNAVPALGIRG
jgi:type IV pilus biogenesis protein CpaD/CtpE